MITFLKLENYVIRQDLKAIFKIRDMIWPEKNTSSDYLNSKKMKN